MKRLLFFALLPLLLLGAGCETYKQKTTIMPVETNSISSQDISATPTNTITKIYSVNEFVENGFREQKKVRIKVGSVTCYYKTCGVEDGTAIKWGVGMTESDSQPFFPYRGKGVDMIIEAEPDNCPVKAERCHQIKNVSIVEVL